MKLVTEVREPDTPSAAWFLTRSLETSKNERLEVSDWTAAQNDDSSEEESDEEWSAP